MWLKIQYKTTIHLKGLNLKRSQWMSYLLLILTVLFWSINFVLGRGIRELIPPVSLNFWRWVGALLILLPFGLPRIRKQKEIFARHWKMVALLSVPSITIFNAFIYRALQTASATNTVLVNAMIPIFIAVLSWPALGDRLNLRQLTGVLTSLLGMLFIISKGDFSMLGTLTLSKGDLWTLGATMAWAGYSVMLRKRPKEMNAIAFLTLLVVFGLFFSLPWYLWELAHKGGFPLSRATFSSLTYVAIFPSVLSFIFWNNGIEKVGANRTGIFIHLMPVFSIVMAILFLGEQPRLFHLFGIILIFCGIALTTIRSKS
jgi:drug/metabolite transporter (DMT)-like permease